MATWFGIVALALLLAGAVAIAGRRGRAAAADDDAAALFRDRRAELAGEARAQGLGDADVAALEEDLALDALDAGGGSRRAAAAAARPGAMPLLGGAALAIALALGLYAYWGEPHATVLAEAQALLAAADDGDERARTVLAEALEARVARHADDAQGWFYLGHLHLRSGEFDAAFAAFERLHALAGGDLDIDLALVQARFFAAGGRLDAPARSLAERVLDAQPEQPNMLELLAMDAVRGDRFAEAAWHLERLLRQPLPQSRRAALEQTQTLARERLDPARPRIEAAVTVAQPQGSWLMVFARAAQATAAASGSPPLAVVRRPARAAQTIVLDAAARMDAAPGDHAQPLFPVGAVEVVARLSRSGAAAEYFAEAVSAPVDPARAPRVELALAGGAATSTAVARQPGPFAPIDARAPRAGGMSGGM